MILTTSLPLVSDLTNLGAYLLVIPCQHNAGVICCQLKGNDSLCLPDLTSLINDDVSEVLLQVHVAGQVHSRVQGCNDDVGRTAAAFGLRLSITGPVCGNYDNKFLFMKP